MSGLWGRRLVALILDAVIITLVSWILVSLVYPLINSTNSFQILSYWLILVAVIIIAYFTFLEGRYCSTVGKNIMKLKVKAKEGDMSYSKAFIRNISKILWLPLIVDLLIGIILGRPYQRYLDRLAKTEVVELEEIKEKPLKTN